MEKITFIINPISGHGKKKIVEKNIEAYLSPHFNIDIQYTKAPKHATELSQKASESSDIVVAVGGDGSIHEVGQALVGGHTKLGIIPMGSGNGLARHLKIPLNIKKAIEILNQNYYQNIDVLDFGDIYGLNVSGMGFDAHIAHEFSNYGKRGFLSYIKLSFREFLEYQTQDYYIQIDDNQRFNTNAFLISLANSSQFGNNAYIAPKAQIDDGYFELVILSSIKKRMAANIGLKLFTKKIDQSKYIDIIKCKKLNISSNSQFAFHIDGEDMGVKNQIAVQIKPSSLKVIVPQK